MLVALRRAAIGCVLGLAAGGIALVLGLGRAALLSSGGRSPIALTAQHPAFAVTYLAAFGGAGAAIGLLAPLRRTMTGALLVGVLSAAAVLLAIFVVMEGHPAAWPRSIWWAAGIGTAILGFVVGTQLHQPNA
jgi:hypothetical protein